MALNRCLHCGGTAELRHSAQDMVYAECLSCNTKTRPIKADVKYCAIEEVEKLWNATTEWPAWESGKTYAKNAKVSHRNTRWISQVASNTWEPGAAGVYDTIWKEAV